MGDAHFELENYETSYEVFKVAWFECAGMTNPFVSLRFGQCALEMNEPENAAEGLISAYMGAGLKLFELEDPRYLDFLKSAVEPPAGGEW